MKKIVQISHIIDEAVKGLNDKNVPPTDSNIILELRKYEIDISGNTFQLIYKKTIGTNE